MPISRCLRTLAATPLLIAMPAAAEVVHDERAWLNITLMGSAGKKGAYFLEFQPRMGDGASRLNQLLLRGAVGWKLSPRFTLYQGYAHVVQPGGPEGDIREDRGFQQLTFTQPFSGGAELQSRTRLEQRWRSDGRDTGWRLREMLRYEHPLSAARQNVKALGYAEGFWALNDTDWGARSGFDQLRAFAGVEVAVKQKSTVEVGYLAQAINQPGDRVALNHVASISLFIRP